MDILIQALGLIVSLSLIVIVHEGGHFAFAKLFNTRVEKFYLFFNPKFSIFKFKKGDTEYGLGWLPLGGYVKIAGMIDESMDKEQMKKPPQPWEFRAKPAWQRFFIMTGGVLFNLILAVLIYIMIMFSQGKQYYPVNNMTNGMVWDSIALNQGFMNGDIVIAINDKPVNTFQDINQRLITDKPQTITVKRNEEIKTIGLPDDFRQQIMAKNAIPLVWPATPTAIDSVLPNTPAEKAGLQKNDRILQIDNKSYKYFQPEIIDYIQKNKNDIINVLVQRQFDSVTLPVKVGGDGKIGIAFKPWQRYVQAEQVNYNFIQSIPAGIKYFAEVLSGYVKQLKLVFTKEGIKQVGSFITIGSLYPKSWNWLLFWHTTALISVILAVMNILPIPALDGGHLIFLGYEVITGRKPGDRVMEVLQIIGMIILFSLLIFALSNDLRRCTRGFVLLFALLKPKLRNSRFN
jgi:regulator of sigma E protease